MKAYFRQTFQNAHTPVIVCELEEPNAILFSNTGARLLINPLLTVEGLKENIEVGFLKGMLRFQREGMLTGLLSALNALGAVNGYKADVLTYQDTAIQVSITANVVEIDGKRYIVLYLYTEGGNAPSGVGIATMVEAAFHVANQCERVDDGINHVLSYAGNCVQVSRVYIFEEISAEMTSNTYEWCAPGIEPAIRNLQALKKEDYNYDAIISAGMYIADDVRGLPENDRAILEAQGIKSLAILPLVHAGKPLGYVGFDDCDHYRTWSDKDFSLLSYTADLIVSLLVRRNFERNISRSEEVLQTISNSMDFIIYANDIQTHEIVFINNTLAKAIGQPKENILGKKCWEYLQRGMEGPCGFCPIPKMMEQGYLDRSDTYTWEIQNTINGKWYLMKDAFVKWTDGRDVHIEMATEITHQKEYEAELKYYASVDSLTGVYNREWGYKIMEEMTRLPNDPGNNISLVFIDLDGLKQVNDTYGHDAGDRFINGVISVLRANKRKSDVICRWGGDEFVLLLKCGVEAAHRVMSNMEVKLMEYNNNSGEPFTMAFSYGITEFEKGADVSVIGTIIARADRMMYENKKKFGKV